MDADVQELRDALSKMPREAIPPLRLALAALERADVHLARAIEAHVGLPDEPDTGAVPALDILPSLVRIAPRDEALWWGRLAALEAERGQDRRCRSLEGLLRLRVAS